MAERGWIPGEWFIEGDAIRVPDGDDAPWNIATIHVCCGHDDDTAPANARLIASAPDLYEALADLVRAAVDHVNEHGGGGDVLARITDARSALSKANGSEGI